MYVWVQIKQYCCCFLPFQNNTAVFNHSQPYLIVGSTRDTSEVSDTNVSIDLRLVLNILSTWGLQGHAMYDNIGVL